MESLFGLIVLVLDLIAIVFCLKGSLTKGKKVLWIILILILPLIGVILYFILGRKQAKAA